MNKKTNIGTVIATTRTELLDLLQKGQGTYENYANALTASFGKGWESMTFGGRKLDETERALRDAIREERELFNKGCVERGIVNPHSAWASVKFWAAGKPKRENGARSNEARPIEQRQREELSKLYKAGVKDEEHTETSLQVNEGIAKLLGLLAVDIALLVK
jgi:hypothetical protein